MDCNKDEAARAKEIAIRKFLDKDVVSALTFAKKALKLYPELEGISHLVANFELHIGANYRRNGEMDLYRMLDINCSADPDAIAKQYRKKALLVHPDKNHEVGSESAFKLLSEAIRVLKDKDLRSAYDQRIGMRMTNTHPFPQNFPAQAKFVPVNPTVPTQTRYSGATDWSQFKKGFATKPTHSEAQPNNAPFQQKDPNVGRCSGPPPRPVKKKANKSDQEKSYSTTTYANKERTSFWTSCSGCKMEFEYLLVYANEYLRCPNCVTAFKAIEIPTPSIWKVSDICYSFSRYEKKKPSQKDGSSSSGVLHAADNGKPSGKRLNQGCPDPDAKNGNLESKRKKIDESLTRKQKTGKAKVSKCKN